MSDSLTAALLALDASPAFNGSSLALAGAIVSAVRMRHAIGGWLFYFFCQVLTGLSLIALTTHWRSYLPGYWNNDFQFLIYFIAGVPRMILLAAIAAVCVQLVRTRHAQWVIGLQYALLTYGLLSMIKIQADVLWFPTMLQADLLSLVFPAVWIIYFGVSRRVRRVFFERTWN